MTLYIVRRPTCSSDDHVEVACRLVESFSGCQFSADYHEREAEADKDKRSSCRLVSARPMVVEDP